MARWRILWTIWEKKSYRFLISQRVSTFRFDISRFFSPAFNTPGSSSWELAGSRESLDARFVYYLSFIAIIFFLRIVVLRFSRRIISRDPITAMICGASRDNGDTRSRMNFFQFYNGSAESCSARRLEGSLVSIYNETRLLSSRESAAENGERTRLHRSRNFGDSRRKLVP